MNTKSAQKEIVVIHKGRSSIMPAGNRKIYERLNAQIKKADERYKILPYDPSQPIPNGEEPAPGYTDVVAKVAKENREMKERIAALEQMIAKTEQESAVAKVAVKAATDKVKQPAK